MGAAGNTRAGRFSQTNSQSSMKVRRSVPVKNNARQEKKEELKKSLFEDDDSDNDQKIDDVGG